MTLTPDFWRLSSAAGLCPPYHPIGKKGRPFTMNCALSKVTVVWEEASIPHAITTRIERIVLLSHLMSHFLYAR
jgi:hypothetical protein